MLNDSREVYNADERLRAEDEGSNEFSTDLDEGNDMQAFLEPGDLVGISS
jgi:hypothetical protein